MPLGLASRREKKIFFNIFQSLSGFSTAEDLWLIIIHGSPTHVLLCLKQIKASLDKLLGALLHFLDGDQGYSFQVFQALHVALLAVDPVLLVSGSSLVWTRE